jgi:hypothetical protein
MGIAQQSNQPTAADLGLLPIPAHAFHCFQLASNSAWRPPVMRPGSRSAWSLACREHAAPKTMGIRQDQSEADRYDRCTTRRRTRCNRERPCRRRGLGRWSGVLRGIGLISGRRSWQKLARHFLAGRALVSHKTRLMSERSDPHDLPHRSLTPGTCNPTSSS